MFASIRSREAALCLLVALSAVVACASPHGGFASDAGDGAAGGTTGKDGGPADQRLDVVVTSDAPTVDVVETPDDAVDPGDATASVDTGEDAPTDASSVIDAAPDDVPSVIDAALDAPADALTVPAVSISTAGPLARATVGTPYTVTITAQGGVAPYTFSLPSLPPTLAWLSIDSSGRLSGTPAQVTAATSFMVSVHDSRSATATDSIASKTYSLMVGACVEGTQVDCTGPLTGGGACGFGKSTCTNGVAGACMATTPSTDTARCGGTCAACDATSAKSCAAGRCKCGTADACATGNTCCASGTTASCVDTATALDNCGGCGIKCPAGGYHCEGGCKCGSAGLCPTGASCCGAGASAACATVTSDLNNCGACGTKCDATRSNACSGGACKCGSAALCAAGQTCCGTAGCLTLTTDMNNCGACGTKCDATRSNACSGGACKCGSAAQCAAGQTCCGGTCVDVAHDINHCLGCAAANICDKNKADTCNSGCKCGTGAACTGTQTCCGGACVDTSTNASNCGGCGKGCSGGTNACLNGTCSCGTHVGACGSGETCCPTNGNTCYNLTTSSSSFNCGSCSHSCLGDACKSGQCQVRNVTGTVLANPFNGPSDNTSIVFNGHTYDMGYAMPIGSTDQDAAIFKDGNVLCVWDTYSAVNEEDVFHGIAVDNNFVYGLLNGGPLGLFKCPINGNPRSVAVTIFEDPTTYPSGGLQDTGTVLYWGTISGQVYRLVK